MRGIGKISIALVAAAMLAIGLVACGGSSGSATAEPETGEASREFVVPGSKDPIPKFGKEADVAEREAASAVLEESSQARASGEFAVQCATLAAAQVKEIEKEGTTLGVGKACGKALEAEAKKAPPSVLADNMTGPIDALRIKGAKAYALYHGKKSKDYEIPMALEGGQWKVAALIASEVS